MRLEDLRQIDSIHSNIGVDADGRLEPTTTTDDFYDEIDAPSGFQAGEFTGL
jgi:hypothetical protein